MQKPHLNPDACIACTTCVVHCPVAQATTEFLGPRMIGPAYERFRLLGLGEEPSLHYCANCKNCDIACPHNVPISTFNMLARGEYAKSNKPPLRDWTLAHGETIARGLGFIPAFLRNIGMLNPITRMVLDVMGVHAKAPLPPFASATFRKQHARLRMKDTTRYTKQVVFFPGCYVDIYDPQTGLDMVWALNRAGYDVIVPEAFRCCGLPMVSNGYWEDARHNASINAAQLKTWQERNIPVLTGCPSCSLMFKADLPHYFPDLLEPGQETSLADAQEFLLGCMDRGELDISGARPLGGVIYHAPCHLRAQGLGLPGLDLLRRLPGVDAQDADAGCCGISGSYGFKKEKYDIAMRVGEQLFKTVRASKAAYVSSECGTCRVQLRHGAALDAEGRPCLHPVTLLRKALEQ